MADVGVGEEFVGNCIDDLNWLVDDCFICKVAQLKRLEDACTFGFDGFENCHFNQQILGESNIPKENKKVS